MKLLGIGKTPLKSHIIIMMADGFGDEFDDDELLQASQAADSLIQPKACKDRFVEKSDQDMKTALLKAFPPATSRKAKWAPDLFEEWCKWRNMTKAAKDGMSFIPVNLCQMTKDEINYSISRFICEVRKADSSEYPRDTTYQLVTSL